jgi:F-type H+-transporting ATPase subunit delta
MSTELVARRYASALADVLGNTGETAMVQTELKTWEQMMASSGDLLALVKNPALQYDSKSKVLESLIAKSQPTKTTANFLRVLLKNQRLGALSAVNRELSAVLDERSGLARAQVTTARELSESERADIQTNLQKLTGRKVNLDTVVNKEILGGVVTRVGSTLYDSSVKTQLENLRNQLIKG